MGTGWKTYTTGAVTILSALWMVMQGVIDWAVAWQMISPALLAMGLRHKMG